jgi:hypothetical protein
MKGIISRLTMKFVRKLFYDNIDKKYVNQYKDKYGTYWMANSKYGYRVKYEYTTY